MALDAPLRARKTAATHRLRLVLVCNALTDAALPNKTPVDTAFPRGVILYDCLALALQVDLHFGGYETIRVVEPDLTGLLRWDGCVPFDFVEVVVFTVTVRSRVLLHHPRSLHLFLN